MGFISSMDRSMNGKMTEHKKHKVVREEKEEPEVQVETKESAVSEADPAAEIAALREDLESLTVKSQEYLDGWQRERAEFTNYKRRVDREREQAYQNAVGVIVRRYLEVLDDLERALKNRPADGDGAAWAGVDSAGAEADSARGAPCLPDAAGLRSGSSRGSNCTSRNDSPITPAAAASGCQRAQWRGAGAGRRA